MKLIGPFNQIVTGEDWPLRGPLAPDLANPVLNGGIAINEKIIVEIDGFKNLVKKYPNASVEFIEKKAVLLPGFIDAHTHICWAGSRVNDFEQRLAGVNYEEIARSGGGIMTTVQATRNTPLSELVEGIKKRLKRLLSSGITTVEIKSGYGLDIENEVKILEAINKVKETSVQDVVPTCLGAHTLPGDFNGSAREFLDWLIISLLPVVKQRNLSARIDIFADRAGFPLEASAYYLEEAKKLGYSLCVHADQFMVGGSELGCRLGALSVDHLESSTDREIDVIARSKTVATVLPGASLGLGMPFAPARKLLNKGACLAIASDWNPGSAPMGNLLIQASLLATFEKLNSIEILAGLTSRAALALGLTDRGRLVRGQIADLQAYEINDYRDLLYYQGDLKPYLIWKEGIKVNVGN